MKNQKWSFFEIDQPFSPHFRKKKTKISFFSSGFKARSSKNNTAEFKNMAFRRWFWHQNTAVQMMERKFKNIFFIFFFFFNSSFYIIVYFMLCLSSFKNKSLFLRSFQKKSFLFFQRKTIIVGYIFYSCHQVWRIIK